MTTFDSNKIDKKLFAEGSVMVNVDGENEIFLLTWKEREVLIYNDKLKFKKELTLPKVIKEGWGMT